MGYERVAATGRVAARGRVAASGRGVGISLDIFASSSDWSLLVSGSVVASGAPSGTTATANAASMHIGSDGTATQLISAAIAEMSKHLQGSHNQVASWSAAINQDAGAPIRGVIISGSRD